MKKISVLFIALVLSLCLFGCTKGEGFKEFDKEKLLNDLLEKVEYEVEVTEVNDFTLQMQYGDLPEGVEATVFMGSTAAADRVCLFEAGEDLSAETLKAYVESTVKNLSDTYSEYDPEEVDKLGDAIIRTNGSYTLLVVTNDTENAEKVIDGYWK